MFRSVPLLLLVFLPAPGPVAPAPTPAGSCCDDPTQLAMARCTGSSSCRACKSCSSCAHCKGGGTCGVCAGEIFGDGQAEEEKAPDLRPLYADGRAPEEKAPEVRTADRGSAVEEAVRPTLLADERYQPEVGDLLTIYRRENGALVDVTAAAGFTEFGELQKYTAAKDLTGLDGLEAKKGIFPLGSGTQVRILEICTVGPELQWRYHVVRVLDGEHKDQEVYVDKLYVKRCSLVTPPAPKTASRPKAAPKPAVKVDKAAVLYRIAQNLYRNNQREAALGYYRQVVEKYPASPLARDAAAKVQILTGK